jgi:curved DNA-binding protein CbpA
MNTANDMNIEQGLFQFDLIDYHAILGVALDADAKQIRKRYLTIARKLHPDSLRSASEDEKQQAHELLSKLVNPAYEKLNQEKTCTEHQVILRLRGQQLSRQPDALQLATDTARSLLDNPNATSLYRSTLQKLADQQYESLENVLDVIGQISDLNLGYLVSTTSSQATPAATPPASAAPSPSTPSPSGTANPSAAPIPVRFTRQSIIESYVNRAREFAQRKDYPQAILEMREAVKTHPNSADCHGELANLYLLAGQSTMARIHLKKALEIDPNHSLSKQLEPAINKVSQTKTGQAPSQNAANKSTKYKGGLFGLFGGKQK